jgi:hypothetical protein
MLSFAEADQIDHPVESQWHHEIMVRHGFTSITKSQMGFVRAYEYKNDAGHVMSVCTGVNADYWRDKNTGAIGYWPSLEPHLERLKGAVT